MEQATAVYGDLASGLAGRGRGPARVPRARRGQPEPPAASQLVVSGGRPAAPARHRQEAAGGRVHRRRQLRLVDAAAPPGPARRRPAGPRRDHPVAVGRQRAAALRLRDRLDDAPTRCSSDDVAGRDLHRDAPSHACRPGLPRPGDREGRLRREAARADQRRASADHRRRSPAPATTGSWSGSTGASRRCSSQMRSRFGQPGGGSVTRYLVNAGRLEADSWYRNEELEGSRFAGEGGHFIDTLSWWAGSLPEEVYAVPGPEQDDLQATVRFQNGSTGTITYVTTGNPRYPKETLDAAAGGRSARLDNFRQAAVWAGRRRSSTRSRGGQDKGQRAELATLRRGRPDRRADADLARVPGRHHQGDDRGGREPVERPPGAGVTATGMSRLGWYARRAARMSPAEVAWRGRDQALQAAWSRRQVGREQVAAVATRRCGERRFARGSPRGHRRAGARGGQGGRPGGRGPAPARRVGGAGRRQDRPGAARLVPRPRDRPPVPAGPLRLPDQPPLGGADRQHQAGLGDLPAAAPHAAGHGLVPQPRAEPTPTGWPTSCAPGGGRTPSCPACTGRAASRSASA